MEDGGRSSTKNENVSCWIKRIVNSAKKMINVSSHTFNYSFYLFYLGEQMEGGGSSINKMVQKLHNIQS
jgi:hypothetical protein